MAQARSIDDKLSTPPKAAAIQLARTE